MRMFQRRRKLTPEETAANEAARRAHDAACANSHCQICERGILSNTGTIAHHGYQRPGQGWQTQSCFGAKYKPYEQACDALPKYIAMLQDYVERTEATKARWIAEPPRGIEREEKKGGYMRDWKVTWTVLRTPGFVYQPGRKFEYHERGTYDQLFAMHMADLDSQIRNATHEIERCQKRLAAWKAPA